MYAIGSQNKTKNMTIANSMVLFWISLILKWAIFLFCENDTRATLFQSLGETFNIICPGEQVRTNITLKSTGTCKKKVYPVIMVHATSMHDYLREEQTYQDGFVPVFMRVVFSLRCGYINLNIKLNI